MNSFSRNCGLFFNDFFVCHFRYGNFEDFLKRLEAVEGGIEAFSLGYQKMGCRVEPDNTFVCTQWAPGAQVTQRGRERELLSLVYCTVDE